MKITITLFVLILGLSSCLQAKTYPKKENNLLGYWKLVKAETNGRPNSPAMMDRTHEFKSDGIFEGRIFVNGQDMPYNSGQFLLANDSTMVCIHFRPDKKLSQVSYTYNFQVKNDSLHLYGIYFSNTPERPNMLQVNYINEWWVKPTTLYNKDKK